MSVSILIRRLDAELCPLDFNRSKVTWNRSFDGFIDVVDVQRSKSRELVTLNAGVLDVATHELVFGAKIPETIEEPWCTVRARIGELVEGKDLWWKATDPATPDNLVEKLRDHVLPFFQRMHSLAEMAEFLIATGVQRRKYPLPILQLAALRFRMGERTEACRILDEIRASGIQAWQARVAGLRARFAC